MRRFFCGLLLLFLCCRLTPVAAAAEGLPQDLSDYFQKGNKAYLNGDYEQATEAYRRVLEAGIYNPDLSFNLANAYSRAGQKGLAVLFYEKTLQMDPNDEAARSNLNIVRKDLIDRVVDAPGGAAGDPLWHSFIRSLSLGWLTWTFLSLYMLVFTLMIGKRLLRNESLRRLAFWVNIPLLTLAMVFGLLLASRIYLQEKVHHGVVIAASLPIREGPERTAKVLMEVHEGLKVRYLKEVGDFMRVRLSNGVEGFIQSSQLGRI